MPDASFTEAEVAYLLKARKFIYAVRKENTDSGNDIPIETQSQIRPQALDFKLGHYPIRLSPDSRRLCGVTIR